METIPDLIPSLTTFTENPVDHYILDKSSNTKRSVISQMNAIAIMFDYLNYKAAPWHEMKFTHVKSMMGVLSASGYSPKTINARLSAVRGVCKTAFLLNQMPSDELIRINSISMIRGGRLKPGRVLPLDDIKALIDSCDDSAIGARDLVLIGLLYICGLRRSEVALITLSKLNKTDRSATIVGKGNKERKIYYDAGVGAAIETWLTYRGARPGPLLSRVYKNGRVAPFGISEQTVYDRIKARQVISGIRPVSPHDFRRTFITTLLEKNIDVYLVQRLAGHSDPKTTSGYDLRGEKAAKQAASAITLPRACKDHQQNH